MQPDLSHSVNRRSILQAAGGVLAVVAAAPLSAVARSLPIQPIDELTLQVIVDSATFGPFLPNENLPGLRIERASGGRNGSARMPRQTLMAEFGLSILAVSRLGSETRHVLVDFGYSAEVLSNNLSLLGIEPERIDATVLSHGHLDHYGGFTGLFRDRSRIGKKTPLIVGGEETFCERAGTIGDPPPTMGALNREELARAGFEPRIAPDPLVLEGHAFTTGLIPLESFERAAIPTQMRPGVGCAVSELAPSKQRETQVPDDGEHELATCFVVRDLGLVVIASCSHRGVLNSIRQAQRVSGVDKVYAVIGGFHLVRPRTNEEARRTVDEFQKINPTYIIPMHCTGEVFIAEALRRMPEKIVRPYVGNKFIFNAARSS